MKRIFTLLILLGSTIAAQAQLSSGQSTASVLRTGNRPEAGDWGIFVGVAYSDFENIFDRDVTFEGFPLVNVKHYVSDNVELRLGLQFQGTSTKYSGDETITSYEEAEYYEMMGDVEVEPLEVNDTYSFKSKVSNRTNLVKPGVAYHFSKNNLLDVYMGAELPIGWDRNETINEYDGVGTSSYNTPFLIGFGAFIGLQCFVADLPIALGVEYGILGLKQFGGDKYKVTTIDADGEKQTYFTTNSYEATGTLDSFSSSKKSLSNDVRVTLSYYFNAK